MSVTIGEYRAAGGFLTAFKLTEKDIVQNGAFNNSGCGPAEPVRSDSEQLKCCAVGWMGVFSNSVPDGTFRNGLERLPPEGEGLTNWNDAMDETDAVKLDRREQVAAALNELTGVLNGS